MITVKRSEFRMVVEQDDDGPCWEDSEEFADERALLARGEVECVGVRAAVTLELPLGHSTVGHEVHSPGLWGIVVATRRDPYLGEVFDDQCRELAAMLSELGVAVVEE